MNRVMEAEDAVRGAVLACNWLAVVLVKTPAARAHFRTWAAERHPDLWKAWTDSRPIGQRDDDTVLDCIVALQRLLLEAMSLRLDTLQALEEVQRLLDNPPEIGDN